MNLELNPKNLLSALASATVLGAVTVFFGRIWTQSYYGVLGVPAGDLNFSTIDYALQAQDALLMLVPAALIAVLLSLVRVTNIEVSTSGDTKGFAMSTGSFWKRIWMSCRRVRRLVVLLLGGVAGLTVWMILMHYKHKLPPFIRDLPLWGIDLWGGVSLGLVIGGAGALALRTASGWRFLWLAVAAGVAIGFPITMTAELAEFQAVRNIRTRALPQAIIEFRDKAPSVIRRSDDPTRSDVVHVVLTTRDRLAVAFPFGCTSLRGKSQLAKVQGAPQTEAVSVPAKDSETCDTFTFDRGDVRSMRIFGGDASRPYNDNPDKPREIALGSDEFQFDEHFDLTVARPDRCGEEAMENVRGVWLQIDVSEQSGRLAFERRPEHLYVARPLTAGAQHAQTKLTCTKLRPDEGVRVHRRDRLLILVGSGSGSNDRAVERLTFSFAPLEFSPRDIHLDEQGAVLRTTPDKPSTHLSVRFAVPDRTPISLTMEVNGATDGVQPPCERTISLQRVGSMSATPASSTGVDGSTTPSPAPAADRAGSGTTPRTVELRLGQECPDASGSQAVTKSYAADQLIEPGVWQLRAPINLAVASLKIHLLARPASPAADDSATAREARIISAIERASNADIEAFRTLNPTLLHAVYKGEALAMQLESFKNVKDAGQYRSNRLHNRSIESVQVTKDGTRAEVRMVETWSGALYKAADGYCVDQYPAQDVPQTLLLERQGADWIVYSIRFDAGTPAGMRC